MNENNILGVILAGGKSKRFGQEKSQVKLGDKTLLEHSLSKLRSKFDKILIVTNNNTIKNYTTINDCIDGQLGPLVGVLSAMKWIKKNNFSYNWIATSKGARPDCILYLACNGNLYYLRLYITKENRFSFFIKRNNIFDYWLMHVSLDIYSIA